METLNLICNICKMYALNIGCEYIFLNDWISNHMPRKGDEITYAFTNFNGATVEGTCFVKPWPCRLWLFELWLDYSSSIYNYLAWVRSQGSSHCVLMNNITISMTRHITWLMALYYIGRRSTGVGTLGTFLLHYKLFPKINLCKYPQCFTL